MPAFDSFRATRWLRTLNLVLQAVLFLTFFLGLNYLARNHAQAWRFDLTRHRKFSLSPETISYVQQLKQPVKISVTTTEDNEIPEVRGLLKEYENATETHPVGKISATYFDPYQNRREAERLNIETAGVIVLECGDRRRAVPIDELYVTKKKGREIIREAFIGEQKITSAMLEVSNPVRKKIYFLGGHGELRLDDVDANRGLSVVREELRIRNFELEPLDLTVARRVPPDADLLIVVAPQSRFSPAEQELLRQFLGPGAGRLLLFLGYGTPIISLGLDDLLLDWGVLVDDDVIFDAGPQNMTESGDLIVQAFDPAHPLTQSIVNNGYTLHFGPTRSVRPDPGRSLSNGLHTVAVAASSNTAWGEVDYRATAVKFDPGRDIRPLPGAEPKERLGIVVASERVTVGNNLPLSVRGGRLVVVGSGDPVSNARYGVAGNRLLLHNAVNWCVDRDYVLNVPARPIERFQLSLSASRLTQLRYTLLFALPGAAALLGLLVYWTRRS